MAKCFRQAGACVEGADFLDRPVSKLNGWIFKKAGAGVEWLDI
jgi:hypothetical protein